MMLIGFLMVGCTQKIEKLSHNITRNGRVPRIQLLVSCIHWLRYKTQSFHSSNLCILIRYVWPLGSTITRLPSLPISNFQLPRGYQSICSVISNKIKPLSYQSPLHTGISRSLCHLHYTLISLPISIMQLWAHPPPTALQQVAIIDSGTGLSPSGTSKDTNLCIGAGLPPFPQRLVTRIEVGEFIDMAELLPDHLGPATTLTLPKPSKQCHDISNILEWIRCFSVYNAVISAKQPHRVPDILGYLRLRYCH